MSSDGTTDPPPGDGAAAPAGHLDTGLELARATARSLAGAARSVTGRAGRTGRAGQERAARRRFTGPRASGAHPDERDPQPLGSALGRLLADRGWEEDVKVHAVLARWSAIVGPEVAQHTSAVSFQAADATETLAGEPGASVAGRRTGGGRLVVRTDSTAWATQLRLLAPTVVRRLNEELGEGTVAVIDVEGPVAPRWSRGRRSIRGARGPRDTYG